MMVLPRVVFTAGFGLMVYGLLFALIGCTPKGEFGRVQRTSEATELFHNGELLPQHRYFFTGEGQPTVPAIPWGILALQEDYTLEAPHWREFQFSPEELRGRAVIMRNTFDSPPRGAWIFDPQGKQVGALFFPERPPSVRFLEDQRVRVGIISRPRLRTDR